jgi:molecular chaperone DnaK (HSP70)
MSAPRYIVGIDLGTTNCAVAYVELGATARIPEIFAVPQLVGEGHVAARPALPSFLYLAGGHEVAPGALALPWDESRGWVVGEFARVQGARVPARLVTSAKSWLCHGGVDRVARILPWGAPDEVQKVSPVTASARYLGHIREAWDQSFPRAPLADQDIILTVPASFDEVARELTVAAAEQAGLPRLTLLEEPQAAFYSWLSGNEATWARELEGVRLVLVVDVGGGTTDFSLIGVRPGQGGSAPALERIAVGDHLLLGGDNIDIALARLLEPRLGAKLDSQRWHALTNLCREAKEALLAESAPESVTVRLVGRGTAVVGGVLAAALEREEVERTVLEGYFAESDAAEGPRKSARAGVQEWGLPFAQEPEVPRHLASFLRAQREAAVEAGAEPAGALARPDAILFNGGALQPRQIRARLTDLVGRWCGGPPRTLESRDLNLAVALGAATYGLARRGRGGRHATAAARSYYLGIGGAAAPAAEGKVAALCLVHRGMEPGETIEIAEPAFDVVANRPVSFPLFASSIRAHEQAGQMVEAERDTLSELPPIRTVLRFGRKTGATRIPVHVVSHLTEVGTLEVWCHSQKSEHRWRLQFQLRDVAPVADEQAEERGAELVVAEEPLAAALDLIASVFPSARRADSGEAPATAGDPVKLTAALEEALGAAKDAWPLPAIRKLWDAVLEGEPDRRRSEAHEARWLNLAGFLLRPGFGHELDPWRIEQLWKLYAAGPRFPKAVQNRAEWWSMWKRVAGGLARAQQQVLFNDAAPALLPRLKKKLAGRVGPQEVREYWQLLGSCEHLAAGTKSELGGMLVEQVARGKGTAAEVWALGRLGARAPFAGPLNCVVAPATAAGWVEKLLSAKARPESLVFALVQLGRRVGDRERDLTEELRQRIADHIRDLPGGRRGARLVTEVVPLEAQERARVLDESLPAGLVIRAGD